MFWWYEKLQFPKRFFRCHSSNSIRFLCYHTRIIIDFFGFTLRSYMIFLVSYKDHIWFLWSHTRISHFFQRVSFGLMNVPSTIFWISSWDHIWKLGFHRRIIYDFFDLLQGSQTFSSVFFFVSWMVHLRFLGFHAGIIYENLGFIQGSYMISLVSHKDHLWFLWSHTRIIHFFRRLFLFFLNCSSMISWISCWGRVWKLGFHTRIIYDFFGFILGSYLEIVYGQYEIINDPCMKTKKLQPGEEGGGVRIPPQDFYHHKTDFLFVE